MWLNGHFAIFKLVGVYNKKSLTVVLSKVLKLVSLLVFSQIHTFQVFGFPIWITQFLIYRYNDDGIRQNFDGPTTSDHEELLSNESTTFVRSLKYIINCSIKQPNRITENIVAVEVFLYCNGNLVYFRHHIITDPLTGILCVGIGLSVIYMGPYVLNGETWAIVVASVIVGLTVIILISLMTQPQSRKELSFKVIICLEESFNDRQN